MPRKSETLKLESAGIEITTQQHPARKSLALMARLGKHIAPVAAHIESVNLQADVRVLAPALAQVFASLDGNEATSLAADILSNSSATFTDEKGQRKIVPLSQAEMIDLVFDGNIKALLSALRFALEVNYRDFFDGAAKSSSDVTP